ncbi:MAG: hypothetical protein ABEJ93_02115 [Candidatus Nanohalobium sp.]
MSKAMPEQGQDIAERYNDVLSTVKGYNFSLEEELSGPARRAITLGVITDLPAKYVEKKLNCNLDGDYDLKDDIKSIREKHEDLVLDFSLTGGEEREKVVEGLEKRFGVGLQALYDKVMERTNARYIDESCLKDEARMIQEAYNVARGRADPYQVMKEEEARKSLERAEWKAGKATARLQRANIEGIEGQRNPSIETDVEEGLVEVVRALERTGAEIGEGVATALKELQDRYDQDDEGMPLMDWEVQTIEAALEESRD